MSGFYKDAPAPWPKADPTIRYHICSAHICLTDTESGAVVISGRDGQPDLVITFADTDAARGFALNAVDVLAAKYDVTRP